MKKTLLVALLFSGLIGPPPVLAEPNAVIKALQSQPVNMFEFGLFKLNVMLHELKDKLIDEVNKENNLHVDKQKVIIGAYSTYNDISIFIACTDCGTDAERELICKFITAKFKKMGEGPNPAVDPFTANFLTLDDKTFVNDKSKQIQKMIMFQFDFWDSTSATSSCTSYLVGNGYSYSNVRP